MPRPLSLTRIAVSCSNLGGLAVRREDEYSRSLSHAFSIPVAMQVQVWLSLHAGRVYRPEAGEETITFAQSAALGP